MYFTQTEIRLDKLVVSSEYISTRLVRKGEITSYYVVRCLSSHKSPTAVGSLCFLKQTIVKEPFVDALMPYASTESNVDKYRRVVPFRLCSTVTRSRRINTSQIL
jgi:hypothetical protein